MTVFLFLLHTHNIYLLSYTMNSKQSKEFLHMKIQNRVNEAKCKALINDKLLSNVFSQDITQMHYESMHRKLEMAYISKQLSHAHNKYVSKALDQYAGVLKSNTVLLETVQTHVQKLTDKERDMMVLQEETLLELKNAMTIESDPIIEDSDDTVLENYVHMLAPSVPSDSVEQKSSPLPERRKILSFSNIEIKTIDDVENEKHLHIDESSSEHKNVTNTDSNCDDNHSRSMEDLPDLEVDTNRLSI